MSSRWERMKDRFYGWEDRTAGRLERVLKEPAVLQPMGTVLTVAMRVKRRGDRAVDRWWAALGLATRRDQERALHALNLIHSRLVDLEESLSDVRRRSETTPASSPAPRGVGE
jgi:hypothetical protein